MRQYEFHKVKRTLRVIKQIQFNCHEHYRARDVNNSAIWQFLLVHETPEGLPI